MTHALEMNTVMQGLNTAHADGLSPRGCGSGASGCGECRACESDAKDDLRGGAVTSWMWTRPDRVLSRDQGRPAMRSSGLYLANPFFT